MSFAIYKNLEFIEFFSSITQHPSEPSQSQKDILVGSILGDSSIIKNKSGENQHWNFKPYFKLSQSSNCHRQVMLHYFECLKNLISLS